MNYYNIIIYSLFFVHLERVYYVHIQQSVIYSPHLGVHRYAFYCFSIIHHKTIVERIGNNDALPVNSLKRFLIFENAIA